jgi:hypothetical protein
MKQPKNIENITTPQTDNAYEWLDDLGDEIGDFIQDTAVPQIVQMRSATSS